MKQRIFFGSGCVIVITIIIYISLNSFNKNSSEVSIAIDLTDSLRPDPNGMEIYSALDLDKYKYAKIKIKINTFSNFDYNSSSTLKLPAKFLLLSNPEERDSAIKAFKDCFCTKLDGVSLQAKGLPKSSIYGPMIRDLNRLARSTAENKIAVYFTDCRENSSIFSAYNKNHLDSLKVNPKKVRELFEEVEKPNNLNGLRIFLICNPTSKEENNGFELMSKLFKQILIDAGAKVYVGADLNF